MFTATLYRPGQAAQVLTASQVADLRVHLAQQPQDSDWLTDSGKYLLANSCEVARVLAVHEADLLASSDTAAVWGLNNALDYDTSLDNPGAEAHVERLFGLCELVGPILVIEQTASPAGWVDGLTFLEEQAEPAANLWFQLLQGPGGYYVHQGPTGGEPTNQYGPYTASEVQAGRFGASILTNN